jgi:hypothetical protein
MIWDYYCPGDVYPYEHEPIVEEHFVTKNDEPVYCEKCDWLMKRLPGGHGLLYFEEGRARQHDSLGDKPITSYAQQKREMRQRGLVETGDNVPPSVAKSPKSIGLKRHMEKDNKGRWL